MGGLAQLLAFGHPLPSVRCKLLLVPDRSLFFVPSSFKKTHGPPRFHSRIMPWALSTTLLVNGLPLNI